MSKPIPYVKRARPYGVAVLDYLDQHEAAYDNIDVRGHPAGMEELP